MSSLIELNDADFESKIASHKAVLVDFWAEWCSPCKIMERHLESFAAENAGRIAVAKMSIEDNSRVPNAHQVMSLPTLILFVDGAPVKRLAGPRNKEQLQEELADFLS